jgi:hypothetical protein
MAFGKLWNGGSFLAFQKSKRKKTKKQKRCFRKSFIKRYKRFTFIFGLLFPFPWGSKHVSLIFFVCTVFM